MDATRCAVLGHLALRDWIAYELTRSMRRSLHWFWPRAESVIYAEVKALVREQLAEAREEPAVDGSARTRAVYTITPAGRRALADYLAGSSTTFTLSFEPLLRVHLARYGSKDDLRRAIGEARGWAEGILSDARDVATEFVEGRHALQGEAHVRGVLFDALRGIAVAVLLWSRRAEREVAQWPSVRGDDDAKRRGVLRMKRGLTELRRLGL